MFWKMTPQSLSAPAPAHTLSKIAKANPVLAVPIVVTSLFTLGTIILTINVVKKDYEAAVARGAGGTPSSFLGYLELNFVRLFRVCNPRTAPEISTPLYIRRGFL